jgi:hypothetical protein
LLVLCRSCHTLMHSVMELYPQIKGRRLMDLMRKNIHRDRSHFKSACKGYAQERLNRRSDLFGVIAFINQKLTTSPVLE